MIRVIYRISDGSYTKPKLPGADKELCLRNFLGAVHCQHISILADNCGEATTEMCKKLAAETLGLGQATPGWDIQNTSLGNAGSFKAAIEIALGYDDDDIVYLVEDDYLHIRTSGQYSESIPERDIEEGLIKADYTTLFDHPDKYLREYQAGETAKVVRTQHAHWKLSISTTMTFATRVKTLREDQDVWKKHTEGPHPYDHEIFVDLREKKRSLAVRIPGTACHTDLTHSEQKGQLFIDHWASKLLENILLVEMDFEVRERCLEILPPGNPLKRLMILATI